MNLKAKVALSTSLAITFVLLAPVSPSSAATQYAITCQSGVSGKTFVIKPNPADTNYLYWYNSAGVELSMYLWDGDAIAINNPSGDPVRVRYQVTGLRSVYVACR